MININSEKILVDGELVNVMTEAIMVVRTIAKCIWEQADDSNTDAVVHDMGVWVEQIIDAAWQHTIKE